MGKLFTQYTGAVVIAFTLAMPTLGQEPSQTATEVVKKTQAGEVFDPAALDAYIESVMAEWRVPGLAVAIVKDDEIIYSKGFGKRDLANNLPVTEHTLFATASTSKAFTSFGVGLLVDEGKLDWDRPLRRDVPGFEMVNDTLTSQLNLRDMLSHRTGLPRHDRLWYANTDITPGELMARLRYLPVSAPIRAKWQYNNLMYVTAGHAIAVKADQTWENFTRQRILDPLGMTRTNFSVAEMAADPDHAIAYKEDSDRQTIAISTRPVGSIGPAGAINSSVSDYAQWMRVLLNDGKLGDEHVISDNQLSQIFSGVIKVGSDPEFSDFTPTFYGLGWFTDSYRGMQRVQHGGNLDGFSAHVTLFPEEKVGSVIFVNKEASPLPGYLSLDIQDRIMALDPRDWSRNMLQRRNIAETAIDEAKERKDELRVLGTQPAHPIASYAGIYEDKGYGKLTIIEQDGRLLATYNSSEMHLDHWHFDQFNSVPLRAEDASFEDMRFNFLTGRRGVVDQVQIEMDALAGLTTFRKKADPRLTAQDYLARLVGDYAFMDRTIVVAMAGESLQLTIEGQPTYTLEAQVDGTFGLQEVSTVFVKFVEDEAGNSIEELQLLQPNGVFVAKRK